MSRRASRGKRGSRGRTSPKRGRSKTSAKRRSKRSAPARRTREYTFGSATGDDLGRHVDHLKIVLKASQLAEGDEKVVEQFFVGFLHHLRKQGKLPPSDKIYKIRPFHENIRKLTDTFARRKRTLAIIKSLDHYEVKERLFGEEWRKIERNPKDVSGRAWRRITSLPPSGTEKTNTLLANHLNTNYNYRELTSTEWKEFNVSGMNLKLSDYIKSGNAYFEADGDEVKYIFGDLNLSSEQTDHTQETVKLRPEQQKLLGSLLLPRHFINFGTVARQPLETITTKRYTWTRGGDDDPWQTKKNRGRIKVQLWREEDESGATNYEDAVEWNPAFIDIDFLDELRAYRDEVHKIHTDYNNYMQSWIKKKTNSKGRGGKYEQLFSDKHVMSLPTKDVDIVDKLTILTCISYDREMPGTWTVKKIITLLDGLKLFRAMTHYYQDVTGSGISFALVNKVIDTTIPIFKNKTHFTNTAAAIGEWRDDKKDTNYVATYMRAVEEMNTVFKNCMKTAFRVSEFLDNDEKRKVLPALEHENKQFEKAWRQTHPGKEMEWGVREFLNQEVINLKQLS